MRGHRIKVGDVFEIELSDGRKAYGQHVFWDDRYGPLVQIFNYITPESITDMGLLKSTKKLFPPVITGLQAAIREGLWTIVGNIPIDDFTYFPFVSTFYNQKTGKAGKWFLWDGKNKVEIGRELPEQYKHYEFLVVWSPYDIIDRIETGTIPYPYDDLIQNNEYQVRD